MFIFLSAWQDKLNIIDNMANTADLQRALHNFGLHPELVLGTYMGSTEQSFAVYVPDSYTSDQEAIRLLAHQRNQHSIMVVDKHMQATLIFLDGTLSSPLGELKQIGTDYHNIAHNEYASYWRGAVWVAQ